MKATLWCFTTVALIFLALAPQSFSRDGGVNLILTQQEASQLNHTDSEWQTFMGVWIATKRSGDLYYANAEPSDNGPVIIIQVPEAEGGSDIPTIETTTTTDLLIEFQDRMTPVDMGTLQVIAKKGFFKKSLTNRLKPYIQGTSLHARGVNIPAGKFLIQVSIADRVGIKTTETYLLKVARYN